MRILFVLFASLVLCSGCKKADRPQLPDATNIGARTFGCKVNGRIFKTSGYPPNTWSNSGVLFNSHADNSISIDARQESPREFIYFRFKFKDSIGSYYLNEK